MVKNKNILNLEKFRFGSGIILLQKKQTKLKLHLSPFYYNIFSLLKLNKSNHIVSWI
jgi:hypothetical protein